MRHPVRTAATRAIPIVALALAVGAAVAGCATATATTSATGSTPAATTSATASRPAASVYGPVPIDPACAAAKRAEHILQTRQGKDQKSESALDKDFINFATALSDAAGHAKSVAMSRVFDNLANDYTDLVESQSGAAQLPAMSQVQKDGTAFDKACA